MTTTVRTTTPSTQRDGSFSIVEMRSASMERERAGTPATALSGATASHGRGLMSQSPIAWTTRKMGHRGDADSLRTDFLQV